MRRLALILAVIATVLSGGGIARYSHMLVAHGGTRCESSCGHSHATHPSRAPAPPTRAPLHDDCPVCDELAVLAPVPCLQSPFVDIVAVLATVHDREAAQLPAPDAPRAVAARPPPFVV